MAKVLEDALLVRMEASLAKFEKQMEKGRLAAEKAAEGSQRVWDRAGPQISANADRATAGIQRLTNVSGRGRFVLQNTANQIGDIAVQMGSGTSASRALGQQMPQLLGGFGALGGSLGLLGPLLGTVAALAIPLGAAFLATSDDAGSLDDQLKELGASLQALQSAQSRASMGTVDLLDSYGSLADEAQALFEIERQMAQIRAQSALDTATRGVAGELGVGGAFDFIPENIRNLEDAIATLREERQRLLEPTERMTSTEFSDAARRVREITEQVGALGSVSRNLDDLANKLGITEQQAREVAAQFAAIGQADTTAERAKAMQQLVAYIKDASDNLANAEKSGKALFQALLEASLRGLELSKIDYASRLGAGADEAGRLADNLARARGERLDDLTGGNPNFFDPRNDDGTAGRIFRDRPVPAKNRTGYKPPARRKGGGARGGADPRLAEAARVYEQTRTEVEKYAAELDRLNKLREDGLLSEDTHMRAVKQLGEQMNKTGDLGRRMGESISDALADMVVNFDNARDAAAGLLNNLARMVANSAFRSLGIDTFFSGLFGSANGNVFSGGRVVPFANGGVVNGPTIFPMRGSQTGLMGEAGPEAIMPLVRGAGGKLGVRAEGGGGSVTFAPVINAPGADAGAVARIENALARANAEFESRAVSAISTAKKRGILT